MTYKYSIILQQIINKFHFSWKLQKWLLTVKDIESQFSIH